MSFGSNVVWRYAQQRQYFSICDGVDLASGLIVAGPMGIVRPLEKSSYTSTCYNGAPVYSTFQRVSVPALPVMKTQWHQFTQTETGSFKYSVYPIIYSVTVSTVMCLFLTIIVFTNHTQRPSWLLRVGSLLASVNLCVLFVRSIVTLSNQHSQGYSSGEKLLEDLQTDNVFNIIDFVFVLIALFCQVQIIIRLFSRVKEKRVSFIFGGTLSICAQTIWGVSRFSNFNQSEMDDNDISILPAFMYLLRIALSMMYSGLIIAYAVGKHQYIFHRSIVLLTILTMLVINLQAAFFIADIANIWVSELSEIFNTTIYVSATVVPWEWINRVHVLIRHDQTEGVLGRPVYEDEYHDIMRYEIVDNTIDEQHLEFDHNDENNDHRNNDCNNNDDNDNNETGTRAASRQLGKKLKDRFTQTSSAFWYFTDQVIAYGLAVPRSVSVSTEAQESTRKRNTKKDVFVYSNKEVVCDSDNEHTASSSRSLDN